MVNAVSNATQAQPVSQATGTSAKKPAQSEAKPALSTDSVQLSQTAQAMLAARQEAIETPAQTATESSHGDLQAQRLLAKEAAARPVAK
jgi:hypothetical protein